MATDGSGAKARGPGIQAARFANLSTGFRLFLILSLALLPLGLIAFLATVQSSRTADIENAARMRIALTESSRKLGSAIASDTSAIRSALEAWSAQPDDTGVCARLLGVMATRGQAAASFAMFGPGSAPVCRAGGYSPARPTTISLLGEAKPTIRIENGRLNIEIPGQGGGHAGLISYTPAGLAAIGAPSEFLSTYRLSLIAGGAQLPIIENTGEGSFAGSETLSAATGIEGLDVEMVVARVPFTAVEFVAILLPLVMWGAAAGIGWLVVDRLLIRPLRRLEREVSAYQPGQIITLTEEGTTAQELRELGATFQKITEMIASHESALAQSLAHQTRLTREVHHRVKNNLQVVASLINLHARGTQMPEVARAYASIQRRVDALAVVHRNHFAELEENRGVQLRPLIGELTQNLRSSVPEGQASPSILLDINAAHVSQDVAVPVSFLLTELVELSMLCDPAARIAISLTPEAPGKARLTVVSPALMRSPTLETRLEDRFGRVLEGLSRQMRSPLERDEKTGEFSLVIPVVADDDFE